MHDHSFIWCIAAADTFQISTDACTQRYPLHLCPWPILWPALGPFAFEEKSSQLGWQNQQGVWQQCSSNFLEMAQGPTVAPNAARTSRVSWLWMPWFETVWIVLGKVCVIYHRWSPRVDLLLVDMGLANPNHLGKWHMFLPADVPFACTSCAMMNLNGFEGPWAVVGHQASCLNNWGFHQCITMTSISSRPGSLALMEYLGLWTWCLWSVDCWPMGVGFFLRHWKNIGIRFVTLLGSKNIHVWGVTQRLGFD